MSLPRRSLLTLGALALAGCGGGGATVDALAESSTAAAPPSPSPTGLADAVYRVTLRNHWTAASFPTRFPSGAHFTGVVGGTHNERIDFWGTGRPATTGIKNMAERGIKTDLLNEVAQAVAAGTAEYALSGGGVAFGVAQVSLEFGVSQRFPRVTLVSMLGPSPDWFTGVGSLSLLQDGQWLARIEMPLRVYDAGTDDGASFTSPDLASRPPAVVGPLSTAATDSDLSEGLHRSSGAALASILFERLS
jgi:Spondin_N